METPAEVKEWAQNTVMGVLFGLILGGGRQWLEDRKHGASTVGSHSLHDLWMLGPSPPRALGSPLPRLPSCCLELNGATIAATWCFASRPCDGRLLPGIDVNDQVLLHDVVEKAESGAAACRATAVHSRRADEAARGQGARGAPDAGHRQAVQRSHQVGVLVTVAPSACYVMRTCCGRQQELHMLAVSLSKICQGGQSRCCLQLSLSVSSNFFLWRLRQFGCSWFKLPVGHDHPRADARQRGGLVIGGLAGVFYGVQLLSSVARAKRDYKDTMAAGLATGMVFGVACARPRHSRGCTPTSECCVP